MLRKAKSQGATVGYVHAFGGENDPIEGSLGGGKGFMVDAALGTTDAVEWSAAGGGSFYPLYAMWGNGIRVTAIGGEDSISNLHQSKLVGAVRTYVYTGARGLDMKAWFEGLRKGNAFVTTGPLVELTVDGRIPGEDVVLPSGGGNVKIKAHISSITPLEKAELVSNGEVIEEIPFEGDRMRLDIDRSLRVTRSGWYHLRVEGKPQQRYPLDIRWAQAFTNRSGSKSAIDRYGAANRLNTPSVGSTSSRRWLSIGSAGAPRKKRSTSSLNSKRLGKSSGGWLEKRQARRILQSSEPYRCVEERPFP